MRLKTQDPLLLPVGDPLVNHPTVGHALATCPHPSGSVGQPTFDGLWNPKPKDAGDARVHAGGTKQRPNLRWRFIEDDGGLDAHGSVPPPGKKRFRGSDPSQHGGKDNGDGVRDPFV